MYISGQLGLKPESRKMVEGGVEAETEQVNIIQFNEIKWILYIQQKQRKLQNTANSA